VRPRARATAEPRPGAGRARGGPLALLLAVLTGVAAAARAQETQPGAPTRPGEFVYSIPAEGITLEQLAKDAELATGRTFLLSQKTPLKGKTIRLAGEARVPADQALGLFQALFVTQGFAVKPLGEATRGVLVVEAVESATDLRQRATFVEAERLEGTRHEVGLVVMTFFQLRHVGVQNLRAALSQFLTTATVELALDVPSADAVIVIGFAPTVFAIKQVIAVMDVPRAEAALEFELLFLKHGVAEEIQPIVADLVDSGAGQPGQGRPQQPAAQDDKPPPRIIADPRMNALAVYAIANDVAEIRQLVAALDAEFAVPARNLRVVRLEHVNAEGMAEVLSETYGFSRSGGSGRGATGGGRGGSGGGRGGGFPSPRAGSPGGEGEVLVIPEPLNNVLVIRAGRTKMDEVVALVRRLDRERPQVLIRGAVVQMTDDQFRSIGTEIAALQGGDGRYHAGALTGFGLSTVQITQSGSITGGGPGSGTGTGGGMGGSGVSQPGDPNLVRIPFFPGTDTGGGGVFGVFEESLEVPILVSLLEEGGRGNLVATPILVATDHSQSSIEATRKIPTVTFQSGAQGDSSSFGGYQEAKVSLTVSPQVSNDDYVRLEIEVIVEAFLGSSNATGAIPPDKTSRSLVGSVTVRDGSTIVAGGLILDNDTRDLRGVPPLAEAAFIGPLLSRRERLCDRASLYFFVSPTIIRSPETLDRISYEKKLMMEKLEGPIRLIDPDFGPIGLDDVEIGIAGIEATGNLDVPRYAAVVPLSPPPAPPLEPPATPPGRSR
jgi:general secretion pathway protein D